jgi:hypothetical protein
MKSPLGSQPPFQSSTCVGTVNVPLNDRCGLEAMLFRGLEYRGGGIGDATDLSLVQHESGMLVFSIPLKSRRVSKY